MDRTDLEQLFGRMQELHVLVVGDVMLDNYWWGDVERISPEAPVPVVALQRRESRLGGAANVALNCRALGARVSLASVTGDDAEAETLQQLLQEADIRTDLLMRSPRRITTTKTRVMSRNQQMLRLDAEINDDIDTQDEHPFIDIVLKFLQREKPQVVIFEDYNKGVLKENVIRHMLAHCREIGVVTAVDPKKTNFLAYRNVTIFKPNLKEVRDGLGLSLTGIEEPALNRAHELLREQLEHQVSFITLSEHGVFYNDGHRSGKIPSHRRNIADVSGAGDTVVATAALVYALTQDAALMSAISNIAGGLVCEEVGVVPVRKELLLEEATRLLKQ